MAGTHRMGTIVSCLVMPKSSSRLVIKKASVTLDFSSWHSLAMASVAEMWELLRYSLRREFFGEAALLLHQPLFDYPLLF